jgi:hypothetical protein
MGATTHLRAISIFDPGSARAGKSLVTLEADMTGQTISATDPAADVDLVAIERGCCSRAPQWGRWWPSPSVTVALAACHCCAGHSWPGIVSAFLATLIPPTQTRVRLARNEISLLAHGWALQINRLHAVIAKDGGAKRILACGRP